MFKELIVNAYNLWVVIFVAFGALATAYGLAIIGSTVGQPNFYTYFGLAPQGDPGYAHTTNIIGALNGVNSAGAVAGAIFQAWAADAFSRKVTIQIGSAILVVGGVLCSGAVDLTMFLVGRVVAGVGTGILACVVPIYQAEISTAETRGAMVAITGVMYAVGYTIAGWLGYACFFMDANNPNASFSWRFPLAFQVLFPLIILAGCWTLPYSPRWLLSKGRRDEAQAVLQRLHKTPGDPNHAKARMEFDLIERQYELDKTFQVRPFELIRTASNRRRTLVGFLLLWGDQFLGLFVLTNYGVLIYSDLGLKGSLPLLLNACWVTFSVFGNVWTALYIDRFGRRTFILTGAIGCTVSMVFLCALSGKYLGTSNIAGLRGAVFFLFFFVFWWCFFLDATQYVYIAEIFPSHLRTQGVAFGISSFYLASEVTLVAAPIAMNEVGWKFYLVLIIPSLVYIVCVYFLFPETKGRTLEEIGALFGDKDRVASHSHDVSEQECEKTDQEAIQDAEGPERKKSNEIEHVEYGTL